MSLRFSFLLSALAVLSRAQDNVPFFVHLALSSDPTQMFVSWRTNSSTASATVSYGLSPGSLTQLATGSSWSFADSDTGREYYLHRAAMTGLVPGGRYYYQPANAGTVSSFLATRSREQFNTSAPLRIAWLGDLGWSNGQALPYLLASTEFDHFTHVGDFAYDLNTQNGLIGDYFQGGVEPITDSFPYMACEGNHEAAGGFQHYANRFAVVSMDNSSTPVDLPGLASTPWNNHWFSYSVGLVHFTVLSTEAYFNYGSGGAAAVASQYEWADADLAAVDRTKTPWVIAYAHRSIYCSCDSDCDSAATTVRTGKYGLEALFRKHEVDIFINGHEHNYERNYAVYNSKLATGPSSGQPGGNASNPEVIVNPTAPVYIVEGCAGDVEHHEPFTRAQPAYSAFRSNTYGYAKMTVFNESALMWEQVQTDDEYPKTTGTVIDAMLLVKS